MNCSTYPFVAVRHGIILSAGDSRAAAAAAARVSRCEIRYATPEEYELLYYGRLCRTLPDSERALLEAIATDINRVLFLVENGPETTAAPAFSEYRAIDTTALDLDEYDALKARSKAIDDELAELVALERQNDLFAPAPA